MANGEAKPDGQRRVGPPPSIIRRLSGISADELLWAKLNENRRMLDEAQLAQRMENANVPASAYNLLVRAGDVLIDAVDDADPMRRATVEHCRALLDRAEACLTCTRRAWSYGRNSDMFWALVHEADEDLVMLMGPDQLALRAREVQVDFKRTMTDDATQTWLAPEALLQIVAGPNDGAGKPSNDAAQRTDAPCSPPGDANPPRGSDERLDSLDYRRRMVRGALHQVNEKADRQFWQLAMNVRIKVWSAFVLIAVSAFVIAFAPSLRDLLASGFYGESLRRGLLALFGVGAAGAIVSNMLSGRKFDIPYGPTQTTWAALYYIVVVPLLGGAAGSLLTVLLRSGLVTLAVTRPAVYVLTAAVGGFLGERVLGKTAEKVYAAMFREASKDVPKTDRAEPKKSP